MTRFVDRIKNLSRSQLLDLSNALHNEILNLRPDEFSAAQPTSPDCYEIHWRRENLTQEALTQNILIFTDYTDIAESPLLDLENLCHIEKIGPAQEIQPAVDFFRQRLREKYNNLNAVVYWPRPAGDGADAHSRARSQWTSALALSIALAGFNGQRAPKLWFITRFAQSLSLPGAADQTPFEPVNFFHAPLLGLGKSLSLEIPECWGGCIDLDGDPQSAAGILNEIARGNDDEVAYRRGIRFTPFLTPAEHFDELAAEASTFIIDPEATYLITGGMGGIGIKVINDLLQRGAGHIAIFARHGEDYYRRNPNGNAQPAHALEHWNKQYPRAKVVVLEADVADQASVGKAFSALEQQCPPLKGVIHAAGVNDIIPLRAIDERALEQIIDTKVLGALHLHRLTADKPLDFEIYFSSMAATWGTAAMSLYAMANRFLESFSRYRNVCGRATGTIAWGPWAEVGMIVKQNQSAYTALGLHLIEPEQGVALIAKVIGAGVKHLLAVGIDWEKYRQAVDNPKHLRLFSSLFENHAVTANFRPASFTDLPASPQAAAAFLRELVAELLNADGAGIGENRPLRELGLTSLLSVELSQKIARKTGVKFRPTVIFDYPTLREMATALAVGIAEKVPPQNHKQPMGDANAQIGEDEQAIAIIGLSCRLPGANSPLELWQRLQDDLIQHHPADRFDIERYCAGIDQAGKAYTLAGGYLEDIASFDHQLFNISVSEAAFMDPQQRLALECSWSALQNAGMQPFDIQSSDNQFFDNQFFDNQSFDNQSFDNQSFDNGDTNRERNIGVFFGVGQNEYGPLCRSALGHDHVGLMPTGQSMNIIPGRLAYIYGFSGPAIAYDTACSSSLVALDAAVESLRRGKVQVALAGGVNALIAPETFVLLSKANVLSRRGRCAAFDQTADGYVRAEGCVVLVLKRLSAAKADGNFIHAVIRGTAVNHDGRSSSLTAPSGRAQEQVMRAALADARLRVQDISVVEAHGTGTPLGDPIEYHALKSVYAGDTERSGPVYLGTLKATLGHTEAASGLAGALRLILTLQHRSVPPQMHFSALNPYIEPCENIVIPRAPVPLAGKQKLYGAVSSFGFSGTNAHVIIESADENQPEQADFRHYLAPLAQSFNRVRCWYCDKPLAQSTGLAQAFSAVGAGAKTTQVDSGHIETLPECYIRVWTLAETIVAESAVVFRTALFVAGNEGGAGEKQFVSQLSASLAKQNIQVAETALTDFSQARWQTDAIFYLPTLREAPQAEATAEVFLDYLREQFGLLSAWLSSLLAHARGQSQYPQSILVFTRSTAADKTLVSSYPQALLSGFNKELATLNSTLKIKWVELAEGVSEHDIARHLDFLLHTDEDCIALSPAGARVPRLRTYRPQPLRGWQLGADKTQLLTGGLGGVGSAVLRWLLSRGAKSVVNINRHAPTSEQRRDITELEAKFGADIKLIATDVADSKSLTSALDETLASMPELGGVFHCAGVVDDAKFEEQNWLRVEALLRPKFIGAWNLHQYTRAKALENFVLFSSLSSLLGNANQANYCLANGLLDSLAHYRRAQNLPALSLNWGPWSDVGMASRYGDALQVKYGQMGLSTYSSAAYLDILANVLADESRHSQMGIFSMDWRRYRAAGPVSSLIAECRNGVEKNKEENSSPQLQDMLRTVVPNRREHRLRHFLKSLVAECLRLEDGNRIGEKTGFTALGIDSIHAMILHKKLERALSASLPRTLSFDYPTVAELAVYLKNHVLRDLFEETPGDTLHAASEDELLQLLQQELLQREVG